MGARKPESIPPNRLSPDFLQIVAVRWIPTIPITQPEYTPTMSDLFPFDLFLSHSSKDKTVVRAVAEQLRGDGLKVWFDEWEIQPGDNIPYKIDEGLERSRVLVLCMSANAFGSDWAQLESYTFRFRDLLNKDRRFIPLRLDDAPIKGSLAQFLYIDWQSKNRTESYRKLLEACRPPAAVEVRATSETIPQRIFSLGHTSAVRSVAFSPDSSEAISASDDKIVRIWDVASGVCLRVLEGHTNRVWSVAWSSDGRQVISGSDDNTVRVWEAGTGKCLHVLEGHTSRVVRITASSACATHARTALLLMIAYKIPACSRIAAVRSRRSCTFSTARPMCCHNASPVI